MERYENEVSSCLKLDNECLSVITVLVSLLTNLNWVINSFIKLNRIKHINADFRRNCTLKKLYFWQEQYTYSYLCIFYLWIINCPISCYIIMIVAGRTRKFNSVCSHCKWEFPMVAFSDFFACPNEIVFDLQKELFLSHSGMASPFPFFWGDCHAGVDPRRSAAQRAPRRRRATKEVLQNFTLGQRRTDIYPEQRRRTCSAFEARVSALGFPLHSLLVDITRVTGSRRWTYVIHYQTKVNFMLLLSRCWIMNHRSWQTYLVVCA